MTHSHVSDHPQTGESSVRQLRALRLMIVVLIPIAIWTVVGLVLLWPENVEDHIREDVSQFSVQGLTMPTGEVTKVDPVSCQGQSGSVPGEGEAACGLITVQLLEGPEEGQQVEVTLTAAQFASGVDVGQKVKMFRVPTGEQASYQFSDFDRGLPLLVLVIVFAVLVVVVARWRGFAALVGLGFAGFILVEFMFPAMVIGENPILVGLVGSSAIMFIVLYVTHGFSARTTTALIGTLFGLAVTAGLGWAVSEWAHLTGVASEDDYLLSASAPDMALTSVVLCGIIVAGLGVLNDLTITQASAVWELAEADPDQKKLFSQAMRIGRDHVASSVYTIAFATAGAGLSALLLITVYSRPMLEVAQTEALSEEIVRTLVGAIGLVLAMPLTTAIGVAVVKAGRLGQKRASESEAATEPADRPKAATTKQKSTEVGQVNLPTEPRVRQNAATTATLDERETTRLPRIRRGEVAEGGAGSPDPAGGPATTETPSAAVPTTDHGDDQHPHEQRRRSRRARDDDDATFNFDDLRGDDPDEQPRGKRWR